MAGPLKKELFFAASLSNTKSVAARQMYFLNENKKKKKFFNIFGNFPVADGHQPSHPLTAESSVEEKLNQISVISSRYVIQKNSCREIVKSHEKFLNV